MHRFLTVFTVLTLSTYETHAVDLTVALSPEELATVSDAVDRGLEWLSAKQNGDGSFGGILYSGARGQSLTPTCHTVLAFLSRGHQPGQGRYGKQMSRAIDFILSKQSPDGSFATEGAGGPSHRHSLSGWTLSEVHGATVGGQAERIVKATQQALLFSRRMQQLQKMHPAFRGGWGYADSPSRSSIIITSSQLIFLRSAQNAGFEVPQEWVDEGLEYIVRCYQPGPAVPIASVIANGGLIVKEHQGAFRLQPQGPGVPPERWGNQWNVQRTASGMLALQYHRRREDPMVWTAADWLASNPITRQGQSNQSAFYSNCYIASQAMAQVGGERWESYFPRVVRRLLPHQDPDGHWRLDVPALGPGRGHEKLGQEYNTALAILCLTLPDQLLPIHQR